MPLHQRPQEDDQFVQVPMNRSRMAQFMDLKMDECFQPLAPTLEGALYAHGGVTPRTGLGCPNARPNIFSGRIVFEGQRGVSEEERPGWRISLVIGEPQKVFKQPHELDCTERFENLAEAPPGKSSLQSPPVGAN